MKWYGKRDPKVHLVQITAQIQQHNPQFLLGLRCCDIAQALSFSCASWELPYMWGGGGIHTH